MIIEYVNIGEGRSAVSIFGDVGCCYQLLHPCCVGAHNVI